MENIMAKLPSQTTPEEQAAKAAEMNKRISGEVRSERARNKILAMLQSIVHRWRGDGIVVGYNDIGANPNIQVNSSDFMTPEQYEEFARRGEKRVRNGK